MGQGNLAGDDAAVQAALTRELERLRAAEPTAALGLEPGASAEKVRERFLELTRTHHPNRFARRPREVVRLANEVFLLYRKAYELAGTRRGAEQRPASTERLERLEQLSPPSQPKLAMDAELARRRRTRSQASFPAVKPVAGPPGQAAGAPTVTGAAASAGPIVTAAELAERARRQEEARAGRLKAALADLRAGKLAQAREALRGLLAETPADRQVRIHLHYTIGREHHSAGRSEEARAEYQRVLGWDPGFEPAMSSLRMLDEHAAQSARGGLLSRWRKK